MAGSKEMKVLFLLAIVGVAVNADDVQCHDQSDCPSYDLCVEVSPTWSQCIDCSNFQYSCGYWDNATIQAASEACQENCPVVPCESSSNATNPCYGGDVCVYKADNSWSQCVNCTNPDFQRDCVNYDTDLRTAAVEECELNCLNTMCTIDDSGMPCLDPYQCVIQQDQAWAQCVDCQDPQVFQTDCYSWTAQFKAAAEAACGLTCPS